MRKSSIFVLIAFITLFFIIIKVCSDNDLMENKDVTKNEINSIKTDELLNNDFLRTHRWAPLYPMMGNKGYVNWIWGWKKI